MKYLIKQIIYMCIYIYTKHIGALINTKHMYKTYINIKPMFEANN